MVTIGHFGYFFVDDADWWSVIGRSAAPAFFFFLGYARSRKVPFLWIWLGISLTLLDSWNTDWAWVSANILISFTIIRLGRSYVKAIILRHSLSAVLLLILILIASSPLAASVVDYGAEGWLWALFGLIQRLYVDSKAAAETFAETRDMVSTSYPVQWGYMRLLACFVAAFFYLWQEQLEFLFPPLPLAVTILAVGIMSINLFFFERGPSLVQPPKPIAAVLRFAGRRTLVLYAFPLAIFELIIKFAPSLAA